MNKIEKIKAIIELCRLNKPFLGVPFMITMAFLGSVREIQVTLLLWIGIAVVSGLTIGNVLNGITDRKIDKINPRTAFRPLACNRLSMKETYILMVLLMGLLLFSVYMISPFYILLLPIPAALTILYSFSKRFTWLCHFILAVLEAAIPFSTWGLLYGWDDWRAVLAGSISFFWIAGFECIYSIQDIEYDRKAKMKSIPAVFGINASLWISAVFHVIMTVLLLVMAYVCSCSLVFYLGIALSLAILLYEHFLVRKDVNNACKAFDLSQAFSLLLMVSAIADYINGRMI